MKIGFFGGTFNPPHIGHIRALSAFAEQIHPDKLLAIPTYIPPLKEKYTISPAHRLEMCRLAFPFAEVCDFEIKNGGVSYTYKTVEYLRSLYQSDELIMLIGTDQLAQLEKWREAQYLFENLTFAVVPRYADHEVFEREFSRHAAMGVKLIKINIEETEISSSELRRTLSAEYLTHPVYSYIKEHNLYMEKSEQIKNDLYAQKPKRIQHIEGVYECALELKNTHFPFLADEDIAEAAYMHDFTKEWPKEKHLALMAEYGMKPDADGRAEKLLHSRTAFLLAKHVYGLSDDVCSAIYYHTTGREAMTPLEKIVYFADYIEKNRTHIDCVDVRDTYKMLLEKHDDDALDRSVMYSLDLTLEELLKKCQYIHEDTFKARNWLYLELNRRQTARI